MNKTRYIALSAILAALVVICLAIISIIPVNTLSLYVLSSFFISIIVVEFGHKHAWLFFAVSSLLGTAIVPNKAVMIPYIFFFGIYGLVKYYIELANKMIVEIPVKLVFFNICVYLVFLLARGFALQSINFDSNVKTLPVIAIIAILNIAFMAYDYTYSLFVQYYQNKIKPKIRF